MRSDNLVFVELAGTQAGQEELPEPADIPHRHPPAVPRIEIADHADPTGVRRPHRKGDALDTLVDNRVRPELAIARQMVALGEQVGVEFTENRGKPIDIVELVLHCASRYAQAIAEELLAIGDGGDEETVGMDPYALGRDFAGRRIDHSHLLRGRQHRTDGNSAWGPVHAKNGERVAVTSLDDRLDLRVRPPGHAHSPPSWLRYRGRPLAECRP